MVEGLVSCIVPTYRRSEMLVRAINSILGQTYKKIEVLVVDDNERNDEYSVLMHKTISENISDSRVKIIHQERHINGAAARNAGIRAAKGEFIAFLDDDDEWKPTKLQKQLELLSNYPDYDGATCLIEEYQGDTLFMRRPKYDESDLQLRVLKGEVSVGTVTLLLRRSALDKTGYFDEKLNRNQEVQLIASFLSGNKLKVLNEYLVVVHRDDVKNRPKAEKIEKIKLDFLNSVSQYINKYSAKERKRIFNNNYFDIVYVAIRDHNIKLALRYIKKIGFDFNTYETQFRKNIRKIKNKYSAVRLK